jgi:hypothetical protein
MKKLFSVFTVFTANTLKQLNDQAEKHTIEIAAMKRTSMETQNLIKTKTMPTQPVNDRRASGHFTAMATACDVLFDGQSENWLMLENHLLNEAENPTLGWNQELLHFQLMDTTNRPFKFLEGYLKIPNIMIDALKDNLKHTKPEDLQKPASRLYKLYSLRTKLINCFYIGFRSRHRNIHAFRNKQ